MQAITRLASRSIRRAAPQLRPLHCTPRAASTSSVTTAATAESPTRPPPTLRTMATATNAPPLNTAALGNPLNLPKWLSENSHLLQPPINNYCVYNDSVTVMIVGGPNARTDYHINETAEWFYQYRGAMLLKTVEAGRFRDITIREGDMFLLPPNTPHNPVRFADTVGIVLEQKRPEGALDRLRWYCQGCGEIVHEAAFRCTDLGTQIKAAVNAFKEDEERRRCANCGQVCDVAPKATVKAEGEVAG